MVGHAAAAFHNADNFSLVVGDGELVERADGVAEDHYDIGTHEIYR